MKSKKQHIVIICGPTASGKTSLALQLARKLPKANILSVDSRQMYQDLDIITGKDIPKKLHSKIKVYGLNVFHPDERVNLADFIHYSHKIIQNSQKSQTPLIIVGGTGLYLKALTENLSNISIPPNNKLRLQLEKMSLEKLQCLLKKENPDKYISLNRSDMMNPRRLIRYLEISRSKSTPLKNNKSIEATTFHWIGLTVEKEILREKIKNRVLKRLKQDVIKEVTKLQEKYPNRNLTIYSSLGVPQIISYLEGSITKDQLIEKWTSAELDYARRQMVWFKKQPNVLWYDKDINKNLLIGKLKKIYQSND